MNKRMYKLELLCVKYVPIIIAAIVLLNAILARFDVYVDELNYIAGTSFLTLIPMYISSIVYKFCKYHRMFIHYILTHKIVATIDMYIGIPLEDGMLLLLYQVFLLFLHYICIKSMGEGRMIELIKKYLLKLVDDIDAGNSNISDSEAIELVDTLKRLTDKEKRMSKYAACRYLNMSRATFDNYVRTGKLPKGKHEIGFKELSYSKKDLDEFIKKYKQG